MGETQLMDRMTQLLAAQTWWNEAEALRAARAAAPRSRTARGEDQQRRAILTRTVEANVIPELLARRRAPVQAVKTPALVVDATHVKELVGLVLAQDDPAALAFVGAMHDRGAAAEAIYLDLLAPTARRLGELWEDDACDFMDVSVGLWRLQAAMRALSGAFLEQAPRPMGPRALLVPLPTEQHTFGLSMVFDFFVRAGWSAWTGMVESSGELATMVRSQWVALLGFSLGCDDRLDALRSEIRSVRRASRNPNIVIMVGGPGFTADPSLAAQVGADGTATDGQQAVLQATLLVSGGARR